MQFLVGDLGPGLGAMLPALATLMTFFCRRTENVKSWSSGGALTTDFHGEFSVTHEAGRVHQRYFKNREETLSWTV